MTGEDEVRRLAEIGARFEARIERIRALIGEATETVTNWGDMGPDEAIPSLEEAAAKLTDAVKELAAVNS